MAQPPPHRKYIKVGDFEYLVQFPTNIRGHYQLEHVLEPAEANPAVEEKETPPPKKTDSIKAAKEKNTNHLDRRKLRQLNTGMAEPRVRLTRHQGQLNFGNELRHLLHAYGDPAPHASYPQEPLPETLRVLDEIVTDFIIETCHSAAQCATYSRRQKIKVDDFRFALRRDPVKLGRVQELFRIERELKEARRAFDQNDDRVGAPGKKGLEDLADSAVDGGDGSAAGGTGTGAAAAKKGKGKASSVMAMGKRGADSISEGSLTKKRKSAGGSVS
ncbi:transcription initiation factor TFIID subunit 13 [[Emmonsia] crescens]|uniref:Transcription initiation factor TFIID subunit 13 n=1 Tax=[Emmonsia] crescens TaxID=73230 RepID=A0A2B7ZBI7_9EURO|nr:transcription initiation factor TFIID subunit 13 [Emmonsia crescens]